jgi:hypothetical protein
MPPPFTSYTPAAGWEKAADHPISWERGVAHLTGPDFIAFEEITVLSWLINAKKHLAVATRTTVTSAV